MPTYLKYSQAVLLPQLVGNTDLNRVREAMEKQGVDELITLSGVKVGARVPTSIHDANGRVVNDIQLNKFQLSNKGWKIQQDLPTKTFKDIDLGSQLQKNIWGAVSQYLDKSTTFNVGGTELTAREVFESLNDAQGDLSTRGIENLEKELGIGEDGRITNREGFYKILLDELNRTGENTNFSEALKKNMSIYSIPGAKKKLENIYFSKVKKAAIKIQTNGGSMIQMANFGIDQVNNLYKGSGGVKLMKPIERELAPPIKQEDGSFSPGQILLPFTMIQQHLPEGTTYNTYTAKELKELIDPRILENVLGYRIPNQGLASNDALEVVGFLPPEAGDTVVGYNGLTVKTGSDFDIDKMFMMIPNIASKSGKIIYSEYIDGEENYRKRFENKIRERLIKSIKKEYFELKADIEEFNREKEDLIGYLKDRIRESTDEVSLELSDLKKRRSEIYNRFEEEGSLYKLRFDPEFIEIKKAISNVHSRFGEIDESDLKEELRQSYKELEKTPKLASFIESEVSNYISSNEIELREFRDTSILSQNTKESVQNRLIELYKSILLHPDIIPQVMTPIDYDFIKNDILENISNPESLTDLELFDLNKQIDVKFSNFAGQAGVAFTANQLSDHNRGLYNQREHNFDMGRWGNQYLDAFESKTDGIGGTYRVQDSLSALLNAFVDIAKDPYITRANWNTLTSNAGMFMIRAGVHPNIVNGFLAQPILKEYVEAIDKSKAKFNEEAQSKVLTNLKKKYLAENFDKKSGLFELEYRNPANRVSVKTLRSNIKEGLTVDSSYEFRREQIELLDYLTTTMIPAGRSLASQVSSVKVDTEGAGKSVTERIILENKISNSLVSPNITGFNNMFFNEGSSTFLNNYYENSVLWSASVEASNSDMFISSHKAVGNTFNKIMYDQKSTSLLNPTVGALMESEFYSYIMSGFKPFKTANKGLAYYLKTLPDSIKRITSSGEVDNTFLNELEFRHEEGLTIMGLNNSNKSVEYKNKLYESFKEIYNNDKALALDLINYAHAQSGFRFNNFQIYEYIPHEFFYEAGLDNYLYGVNESFEGLDNLDSFSDQFIRHNWDNTDIVPVVKSNQVVFNDLNIGFNAKEEGKSPVFVRLGDSLYKSEGYTEDGNAVYFKTHKLGLTGRSFKIPEYSMGGVTKSSKAKANRVNNALQVEKSRSEYIEKGNLQSLETYNIPHELNKPSPPTDLRANFNEFKNNTPTTEC